MFTYYAFHCGILGLVVPIWFIWVYVPSLFWVFFVILWASVGFEYLPTYACVLVCLEQVQGHACLLLAVRVRAARRTRPLGPI